MNEVWKAVEGFENKLEVSNLGRVANLNYRGTGERRIIPQSLEVKGYHKISINIKGKVYTFKVHRLVAKAFIPNPNNYKEVNHKDENKDNNCVDNLEWCDTLYNCNYGTRNARHSIPVIGIAPDGKETYYPSMTVAARSVGGSPSTKGGGHIWSCLRGTKEKAFGYRWRYAEVNYELFNLSAEKDMD